MSNDTPVKLIAKEISEKSSAISKNASRIRRLAENMDGLKAYTEAGIVSVEIVARNKRGNERKIYHTDDYEFLKQVIEFTMDISREEFQQAADEIKKTAGEF